jgi:DNA-directed RNA polymerase specialized sigma24 family protein
MTALGLSTMRRLIDELPKGERHLVYMRWTDGLTDREIAEITGDDPVHITARLAALEQVMFARLGESAFTELDEGESLAA